MKTSLIVPVGPGRSLLLRDNLFESLHRVETMPHEVVVVDDGDLTTRTKEICEIGAANGLPIVYVRTNNLGDTNCCHAQNVGLKVATGDQVARVCPEVSFDNDVIGIAEGFRASCLSTETLHPRYASYVQSDGTALEDQGWWLFWHVPRQALLDVNGWDENMPGAWGWDDVDCLTRLEKTGHMQVHLPHMRVTHAYHPPRDHDDTTANETHFRAKQYPRDLVANVGREWGVPK